MMIEKINNQSVLEQIDSRMKKYREANGIESVAVSLSDITPDGYCRLCNQPRYMGGASNMECSSGWTITIEQYNQTRPLYPQFDDDKFIRLAQNARCPQLHETTLAAGLPITRDFDHKTPGLKTANESVTEYGRRVINSAKTKSIIIIGPTGVGKTHLLTNLHTQVGIASKTVKFTKCSLMAHELRECTSFSAQMSVEGYLDDLSNCRLLLIDDFGAEPENLTSNMADALTLLLDYSNDNDGFSLGLTTNLSGKEIISRYGERVASRIIQETKSNRGGAVITIKDAPDHRRG